MPTTKDIIKRLVTAEAVRRGWEEVTDQCYGKAVANEMKEIAPGDPYLLYDFCGVRIAGTGAKREEIVAELDAYTETQWSGGAEALMDIVNKHRPA